MHRRFRGGPPDARGPKEDPFEQRAAFIREHYPGDAERMIREALEGASVEEVRDKDGDIVGLLTYYEDTDHEGEPYLMLGVSVTDERSRGEGVGTQLFQKVVDVAKARGCGYMTAKADTSDGEAFMEALGFGREDDPVTGAEHFRYDIT